MNASPLALMAEGATGSMPSGCSDGWEMRPTCQSCRKIKPPALCTASSCRRRTPPHNPANSLDRLRPEPPANRRGGGDGDAAVEATATWHCLLPDRERSVLPFDLVFQNRGHQLVGCQRGALGAARTKLASAQSIAIFQVPTIDRNGNMILLTRLVHGPSGQWIESEYFVCKADLEFETLHKEFVELRTLLMTGQSDRGPEGDGTSYRLAGGELGWPNPTRPGVLNAKIATAVGSLSDVCRLKAKSNGRWALGKQTHPYREDARCDRCARCILSIIDACLFQC
jgi:hypothetical protein